MRYTFTCPVIIFITLLLNFVQVYAAELSKEDLLKVAEYKKMVSESEKKGYLQQAAFYLDELAYMYSKNELYDDAIKYYRRSLSVHERIDNKEGVGRTKLNLATAFENLGKYNKAARILEGALEDAAKINNEDQLRKCYKMLAEIYGKMGKKHKEHENMTKYLAYEKHRENKELKIVKEQKTQELEQVKHKAKQVDEELKEVVQSLTKAEEVNVILSTEKQLQEISLREQQVRLEKEATLRNSVLGGFFLTGVLAFVLFKGYREKKKTNELIADQNNKIMGSINYAQRIQEAMLPNEEELRKILPESFIFFKPREVVSGDFYWFSEINTAGSGKAGASTSGSSNGNNIMVAAVDCTGHGVPGAFMSMIGYIQLNNIIARDINNADKVLNELHQGVRFSLNQEKTNNQDGMDMALCVIDKDKKQVEFAGAKNPLVYISKGELVEIKGNKFGIGGTHKEGVRTYAKHSIAVHEPTTFYMFSDGFADQFGGTENRKFLSKNLKNLLLQIHTKPMDEQREALQKAFEDWKGNNRQIDDVLIMGFKL